MSDRYDDVLRRLEKVEQELREARAQLQKRVVGTRQVPIQRMFLFDNKTGSIAEVDYDSATGAVRATKVR